MDTDLTRDSFHADGTELWAASEEESGLAVLEGWAVTYRREPNFSGRILVPGAFHDSLTRRPSKQKPLPIGYEHSSLGGTNPCGKWGAAFDDPKKGVHLTDGRLSDTTTGRDVSVMVRDGVLTGLSVGFITKDAEFVQGGEEATFDTVFGRRKYKTEEEWGDVMFVTQGELMETSVVSAPADDDARLTHIQSSELAAFAANHRIAQSLRLVVDGLELVDGPLTRDGCDLLLRVARDVVPGRLGTLSDAQIVELRALVHDLAPFLEPEPNPDDRLAQELRELVEKVRS